MRCTKVGCRSRVGATFFGGSRMAGIKYSQRCFDFAQPDKQIMSVSDLPAVNASLNLVSAVFISMGWYLIRHGAWRRHMACMITAVISSTFFLDCYVVYHEIVVEKSIDFASHGMIRT